MSWTKRLARASLRWRRAVGVAPAVPLRTAVQHYFQLAEGLGLVRLRIGPSLYVDPLDEQMSAHLIAYAAWDAEGSKVVDALLDPGARVVEVGANIGYYTMLMADRVGPSGQVIAFEANPRLISLLRRSLRFNGFDARVRLMACAAGDVMGEVDFVTFRHNSGAGHVPSALDATYVDAMGEPERFRVPCVRLDEVDCGRVDLIRMDAEGSEPAILRGAAAVLDANPDVVICMEWSVVQMASHTSVPDFVDWLTAKGFRFWRLAPGPTLVAMNGDDLLRDDHFDLVAARALPVALRPFLASRPRG